MLVDVEVGRYDHLIHDIGALRSDGAYFHTTSKEAFFDFLGDVGFVCGHNIVHHDAQYLFDGNLQGRMLVDTLYMSPLLFPEKPYHRLVKDDKLINEQANNPVNDCKKAEELLTDEVCEWNSLPEPKRRILTSLLGDKPEFEGFLRFVGAEGCPVNQVAGLIEETYAGRICRHARLAELVDRYPCELAYALALVDTTDSHSVIPGWVLRNYPEVEYVLRLLRHTLCSEGCDYCNGSLDIYRHLKSFFGYEQFRTFDGNRLQEKAVEAAVAGKSMLVIFPTGGGKSLAFQLPALMAGRSVRGLTVVISPLQSLMKDQVDNLAARGITDAVTINGLLDPIARAASIQRVIEGDASLLYISPEMLRSNTVQRILSVRQVVRFVIDEAHCFSSWGQDFRVDYLYIGKFIRDYQRRKGLRHPIPVSCFTATAKQKVVQDICDYFMKTLGCELQLFASGATRTNLRYSVIYADTDEVKYQRLRALVSEYDCPIIVYVSRTRRTRELANKLTSDGYKALPFNGKMEPDEKTANQDAFMSDRVRIIVATSAFGMGVDKKDVGLVVHYDISDSLENYVQEAGRAGRDPQLEAKCFVLYCDRDLDKHFILLNQTKLSISEINQVWRAVTFFTKTRDSVSCSALEIARQAGWDDTKIDIETRVRTALSALEQGGYLERGNNMPQIYATGIVARNVDEARRRITESVLFDKKEVETAVRIIRSLISQKYTAKIRQAEAESRVDYLADRLGLTKREVVTVVERMRQEGILADNKDLLAYLNDTGDSEQKSRKLLDRFAKLEQYVLQRIPDSGLRISYKQLNDDAVNGGVASSNEKDLRTLLFFYVVKGYVRKREEAGRMMEISRKTTSEITNRRYERRNDLCRFIISWLYRLAAEMPEGMASHNAVSFSVVQLLKEAKVGVKTLFFDTSSLQLEDIEEALLYLSMIGALKIEGGFLVLYQAMQIRRKKDRRLQFKKEDYHMLDEFYKQKIQQVHIVGEYANLMVRDYEAALRYVRDYFQMDYQLFVRKYFKGDRAKEIARNITPAHYHQLFDGLSDRQNEIITDDVSKCIVVAAGPGSGKTLVLVRKLASLLLLEDVKHEQLLMLTFSRSAATEFKRRLIELIGNAVYYVDIKTFHSYCFDLIGRNGSLEEMEDVVAKATQMIVGGEVEVNRISKTVLVIDEAQDMNEEEYALVRALMAVNDNMRVIAVGDDDQNIYEFRGACSDYMLQLSHEPGARLMEMTDNYRSSRHVVDFANSFLKHRFCRRIKTTPIVSVTKEEGRVEVTRHLGGYMYQPLLDDVLRHRQGGTTSCVLTQTNEEAVILVALLRKHGVNSQLVQSMDGFRFYDMAEVRYFMKKIDRLSSSPIITDEVWESAKSDTLSAYKGSSSLPYLEQCLKKFEQVSRKKYMGDFREFVFESAVEDFCDVSGADVVVSTIHKAKGREFDDVYMLVTDIYRRDDDLMRRFYVGMTRARKRLFIHTDGNCFDRLCADQYFTDPNHYEMPEEVVLQLSHRDVFLDRFKDCKRDVLALRGGDSLSYRNDSLYAAKTGALVACLSKSMLSTLAQWKERGYEVLSASVRFIVAWKPKTAQRQAPEEAVLLPELVLGRQKEDVPEP